MLKKELFFVLFWGSKLHPSHPPLLTGRGVHLLMTHLDLQVQLSSLSWSPRLSEDMEQREEDQETLEHSPIDYDMRITSKEKMSPRTRKKSKQQTKIMLVRLLRGNNLV